MIVREERREDRPAVAEVVARAFGREDEALLVERLRRDGDLVLALVAEGQGGIIGHAAFSRMTAPFGALGLAPVAVAPEWQGQGIGSGLILKGLERLRSKGWDAVFVLGEPRYYARFGFSAEAASSYSSPYAGPHFMMIALRQPPPPPAARIDYPPAFSAFE